MYWMNSPWFWWSLALALFAAEALLPGAFMLWLGLAAVASALLNLLLPDLSMAWQWIAFGGFSLVAVYAGWRYRLAHPPKDSDQPLLNRRGEQLIGQIYVLESAIVDGRGRVKVGDAYWAVVGDDRPSGSRVRVIGIDGITLRVAAVE